MILVLQKNNYEMYEKLAVSESGPFVFLTVSSVFAGIKKCHEENLSILIFYLRE